MVAYAQYSVSRSSLGNAILQSYVSSITSSVHDVRARNKQTSWTAIKELEGNQGFSRNRYGQKVGRDMNSYITRNWEL